MRTLQADAGSEYLSTGSNPADTSISFKYESIAIKELFRRLPLGIFLLSAEKELLYCNHLAEDFFAKVVSSRFSKPIAASGSLLYSMCKERTQYTFEDTIYEVSIQDYHSDAYYIFVSSSTKSTSKYNLSLRQQEIADLVAIGLSNKEIAAKLYLSVYTVNKHVSNLFKKLNVSNRKAAIFKLLDAGGAAAFSAHNNGGTP